MYVGRYIAAAAQKDNTIEIAFNRQVFSSTLYFTLLFLIFWEKKKERKCSKSLAPIYDESNFFYFLFCWNFSRGWRETVSRIENEANRGWSWRLYHVVGHHTIEEEEEEDFDYRWSAKIYYTYFLYRETERAHSPVYRYTDDVIGYHTWLSTYEIEGHSYGPILSRTDTVDVIQII